MQRMRTHRPWWGGGGVGAVVGGGVVAGGVVGEEVGGGVVAVEPLPVLVPDWVFVLPIPGLVVVPGFPTEGGAVVVDGAGWA
jgi:hypothetical protein